MMRFLVWTVAIGLVAAPSVARGQFSPSQNQGNSGQAAADGSSRQVQPSTTRAQAQEPGRPIPPLSAEEQQRLDQLLLAWQEQSQATERLECNFTRWHYDLLQAPAGVHATWAQGQLRYAAPDKGLFRVDTLKFFKGMEAGKPQYKGVAEVPGEYWVCTGKELLDFDRQKKVCTIKMLPPDLQGTQIFESPLPFVFNLDAEKIKQRYWLRLAAGPEPGVVLVEAWPKRQEDRAQYKLVRIVIDEESFLPKALLMYAPNFHAQRAPSWDHYEFTDVQRNSMKSTLQNFVNQFIQLEPGASWKKIKEHYQPPADADPGAERQARQPREANAPRR
jgi:TIGR03009 family protein